MAQMSIATIDKPEFINLQPLDINPLMSLCEIKVLYVGQNRNKSAITKEVAIEMSKTLRGAPIVGWYREEKEDFGDHGDRVVIDGEGIKFECLTKPYGFVSPNAKVWFQKFEDIDEFGNNIEREYLMTTGYLWTGQFPEVDKVLQEGHPHSMELDGDSLQGHWAKDNNSGIEFFIINDAIFSKLCILGNDVEPCFEGSSISTPEISKTFTEIDSDFKNTLYNMMQELHFALKGGSKMEEVKQDLAVDSEELTPDFTAEQKEEEKKAKKEEEDKSEAKKEDGEKQDSAQSEEPSKNDEEDKEKKYALLQEQFSELEQKYSALDVKYQELVNFKESVENEKKDELIKSFYMLSDEDKQDVIDNKAKYSLDEIEAKLSVICVRKKVNFDLEDSSKNEEVIDEKPITTFNLDSAAESNVPAWISALRNTQNSKN